MFNTYRKVVCLAKNKNTKYQSEKENKNAEKSKISLYYSWQSRESG